MGREVPYSFAHSVLFPNRHSFWRLAFAWLLVTGIASAFPPAPYHTLYGMVRDKDGPPDTWTRVPFSVGAPGAGSNAYQASDVGIVSALTAPRSGTSEFYRLSVR